MICASVNILWDNGTEFSNDQLSTVTTQLGMEYKIYTPLYHLPSYGWTEEFHVFLKACIYKHVSGTLEWDHILSLAFAVYYFLLNEHSIESPFFLMFGCDQLFPLNTILKPKIRYLHNEENILSLALEHMHELVVQNLKKARKRKDPSGLEIFHSMKSGNAVLRINTAGPFDPTYIGDCRVISVKGKQVEVKSTKYKKKKLYILPMQYISCQQIG